MGYCVCWQSRHVALCFTVISIYVFMFKQDTDLHASSLIFSIPMWLLCSCCSVCFCNWKGIIIILPFIIIPSIIANSILISQYCLSFDLLLSSCVAHPVLYMPPVPAGLHPYMLLPVCLVWICTPVCSLMYWWQSCLPSFLQSPGLCFLCCCCGLVFHEVYIWPRIIFDAHSVLVYS